MNKLPIFFTLMVILCASCQTAQRSHEFTSESLGVMIPHIEINNEPFANAVSIIIQAWGKEVRATKLPYAVYYGNNNSPIVTLKFSDITVKECLDLVTGSNNWDYHIAKGDWDDPPGTLVFGPDMIIEDWHTVVIDVSDRCMDFLNITENTTPEELTARLKLYGIEFVEGVTARSNTRTKRVVLTALPKEIHKFQGLLGLIEKDMIIKKH